MNKQELAKLRFNLVSAVTDYDRKQSTKSSYNMYALPQYLERVSEIMDDIAAGADSRSAISAGFAGTLLSAVMRKLKINSPTREEIQGIGSVVYTPVAKRNPARRPKESPLYVKYLSLKSDEEPFMMQGTKYEYVWAEYPGGIKDIGVYSYANDLVYSYDSFRQMMNLPNPLKRRKGESVRDFTSRCMSEEKASFPKTKQRIAVCLSKSRKRNPLESGASISDDEDINARASNMG
jgi:hypothetical protein